MNSNSMTYQAYVQILKEELLPAMGCTEPIAIAYCAAKARDVLGEIPDSIEVEASGNIIKMSKALSFPTQRGGRAWRQRLPSACWAARRTRDMK